MVTFLIGGAHRSRIAESLCLGSARVECIATAQANDEKMPARIARHASSLRLPHSDTNHATYQQDSHVPEKSERRRKSE
jgi:adenosyl cobinamide kinase/adenosyl cobinamide phosphate guanylyltransferase